MLNENNVISSSYKTQTLPVCTSVVYKLHSNGLEILEHGPFNAPMKLVSPIVNITVSASWTLLMLILGMSPIRPGMTSE